ncbi:MAG: aminotransferase class V-fold PLP-dependent enzyme [Hymenobacter sp.]
MPAYGNASDLHFQPRPVGRVPRGAPVPGRCRLRRAGCRPRTAPSASRRWCASAWSRPGSSSISRRTTPILFTSSATECWEILTQSLTPRRSFHLYNGSFGQKWFDYARALRPGCTGLRFDINDVPDPATLPFSPEETDLVCLTQNETSTATQLRDQFILNTFNRLGPALLAVDATSSLGVALKFIKADVWYGSVQKCLGLPAGLGLLVLSPRAVARAREVGDNAHYNSLNSMVKQMLNYQTTHTPNVLGIYLLSRVLQAREPIKVVAPHLTERAQKLYDYFEQVQPLGLRPLVENPEARSTTVDRPARARRRD